MLFHDIHGLIQHLASRGLIDGATTLELDNGLTKVRTDIKLLTFSSVSICSFRMAWWWSGTTKVSFLRNAKIPALPWVVNPCLPLAAQYRFPRPVSGWSGLSVSSLDTWGFYLHSFGASYVGKYIANLTLVQIKTLDCGSKRQAGYRKCLHWKCDRSAILLNFIA